MQVFVVSCDEGRVARLGAACVPLGLDLEVVAAPLRDDAEVLRRGRACFEHGTSEPRLVACALGHLRALARVAAGPDSCALVVEDDVRFRRDIAAVLRTLADDVIATRRANLVSVGFVNFPRGAAEDVGGLPVLFGVGLSNPWGTQAYVVSRDSARALAERFAADDLYGAYQGAFAADWVLFDPALGCRRATLTVPAAIEAPGEASLLGSTNKPDLTPHLDLSAYCL